MKEERESEDIEEEIKKLKMRITELEYEVIFMKPKIEVTENFAKALGRFIQCYNIIESLSDSSLISSPGETKSKKG